MKLLSSNEVCELLGISKSTLYRWCGVSDESAGLEVAGAEINKNLDALKGRQSKIQMAGAAAMQRIQSKMKADVEETPSDFPRPFKIGRSFKWKDVEIMAWLETRRV